MKKIICTLMAVVLLLSMCSITSFATGEMPEFNFELSVDGKDTKEVKTGDIITVTLRLKRTDADEQYTMYAMQDEIRYDSTFFELVENSEVLSSGISTTDIAMVDRFREFYMNYLSMSGGMQWEPETLIGSFQLKVIGESGVTHITNEDYLVSLKDGSGSYNSTANDLTIILSTDCTVKFHSNGGSELPEQVVQYGEKIIKPDDPFREGYHLEGWYTDINLTEEWDFENNTVSENMSLYAKWAEGNPEQEVISNPLWLLPIILVVLIILFVVLKKKSQK